MGPFIIMRDCLKQAWGPKHAQLVIEKFQYDVLVPQYIYLAGTLYRLTGGSFEAAMDGTIHGNGGLFEAAWAHHSLDPNTCSSCSYYNFSSFLTMIQIQLNKLEYKLTIQSTGVDKPGKT